MNVVGICIMAGIGIGLGAGINKIIFKNKKSDTQSNQKDSVAK